MGFSLHHERRGNNPRRAVVFLHGFLGDHRDWQTVVNTLAETITCLCVDLPGHGNSIGGPAGAYSFDDTAARIVEEVVDANGFDTFCLAGYSMGGRIALYTALHFPMRVDGLILESATPGLRDSAARAERTAHDEALASRLACEPLHEFLRAWYDQPLFATLARNPALLEEIIQRRMNNDSAELAEALRGLSTGRMPSLWDEWKDSYIPSLLITGQHDAKFEAIAHEMAAACPKARRVSIPGAGHNVHAECPADYTAALRSFLAEDTL